MAEAEFIQHPPHIRERLYVDLSVKAVRELFASLKPRHQRINPHGYPEIYRFGKWRLLARTSLIDDVGTLRSATVAEMLEHCIFGARLRPDALSLIDSMSDG